MGVGVHLEGKKKMTQAGPYTYTPNPITRLQALATLKSTYHR